MLFVGQSFKCASMKFPCGTVLLDVRNRSENMQANLLKLHRFKPLIRKLVQIQIYTAVKFRILQHAETGDCEFANSRAMPSLPPLRHKSPDGPVRSNSS